jgi:predicted secreted protein
MLTLVAGLAIGVYLGIALMSLLALSARAQDADHSETSLGPVPTTPVARGARR